jgi:hypothetical protein
VLGAEEREDHVGGDAVQLDEKRVELGEPFGGQHDAHLTSS